MAMKPFKLDNHAKIKPGFTVPEGYFETFEVSMMQQIAAQNSQTSAERVTKVISLRQNQKSWWYAAAAVLILALSIPAINTITATDQTDMAALDNYFAYAGLSDDQIVELLESEDIDNIKIDYQLEDAVIEDALQTGTIENYILD
jgi:hypothetical protein